jgi:hypothetical protein
MNSDDQVYIALLIVGSFLLGIFVRRLFWLVVLSFLLWIPFSVLTHCGHWLLKCTHDYSHASWLIILVPYMVTLWGTLTFTIALVGRWCARQADRLFRPTQSNMDEPPNR